MIKVAIPVTGDLLSKDFGECSHLVIYEINNKDITNKKTEDLLPLSENSLLKWAETSGITDVIAHSINNHSIRYLSNTKINLFIGVTINTPERLIDEYLKGTLQSNAKITV